MSWRWAVAAGVLLALIIVPFVLFEEEMNAFAAEVVAGAGGNATPVLAAAFAALLASDVLLPVPSSVVGTAAGAVFGFALGAAINFAGMTIGSTIAWALGRSAGRAGLARWLSARELERAEALARRHGTWAIVFARPVPVLAEASALFAGAIAIPFARFTLASALANLGIALAYSFAGSGGAVGSSFLLAFGGAIGLPAVAMLLAKLLGSRPWQNK